MKAIVWSKDQCPYCDQAKALLKSKGLEYVEFWADANVLAEQKMREENIKQMPAIYINEQYVGGLAGLQAALKQLNF